MKPDKAAAQIVEATRLRPALGLVLGSGFAGLQHHVKLAAEIRCCDLPGFPQPRVDGHSGKVVIGELAGEAVLILCGRCHYYEGFSMAEITFPVRVLAACGVRALVLTNSAGGINPKYRAGDFMALADHINWMGVNPLRGPEAAAGGCFVALCQTYDPYLNKLLGKAARQAQVPLHLGVYAAMSGPTYETPAEIRALARLGVDAVGMSTVPEAIVAKQCGLRVAAVSCISNAAAGLNSKPISHPEVLATGNRVKGQSTALLTRFVRLLAGDPAFRGV